MPIFASSIAAEPRRLAEAPIPARRRSRRTRRGHPDFHIERGHLLDILEHPNATGYVGQRIFVVRREDYGYLVPFVEDEHGLPETIIPSRKATNQSLGEGPTMKMDADEKELRKDRRLNIRISSKDLKAIGSTSRRAAVPNPDLEPLAKYASTRLNET